MSNFKITLHEGKHEMIQGTESEIIDGVNKAIAQLKETAPEGEQKLSILILPYMTITSCLDS